MTESPAQGPWLEERLAQRGFRNIDADLFEFPNEVTGRIPPDWHWFYFRERSGNASLEIYRPGLYPFWTEEEAKEAEGKGTPRGWDPAALLLAEPMWCIYRDIARPEYARRGEAFEQLILEFVDAWRSGAASMEG